MEKPCLMTMESTALMGSKSRRAFCLRSFNTFIVVVFFVLLVAAKIINFFWFARFWGRDFVAVGLSHCGSRMGFAAAAII